MSRSFEREKRLLSPKQFKMVFDSPSGKISGKQVLLLARQNNLQHPRLGLVIGKKNVRLSVERNRIKRQIRESFRVCQDSIGYWDIVVIARKGLDEHPNSELSRQFSKLWKRISHLVNSLPEAKDA